MLRILKALFSPNTRTNTPGPATKKRQPPPGAIAEAKREPIMANGYVYEFEANYGPEDTVPPEAIHGAWKVDEKGNIVGEFIPNPDYRPKGKRPSIDA